jgi:broad specificity phosphatase PhoE
MLYLVRHGRPLVDPAVPAAQWRLDPTARSAIDVLRGSLPRSAAWFSSPEPKALDTAKLLTDAPVTVLDALAEQHRSTLWYDDHESFKDAVVRAFASPHEAAAPGWEPLDLTRERLVPVVRRIIGEHAEVVLVGHGTAWTLLVSELTGRTPDLYAWRRLRMPDLWVLPAVSTRDVAEPWL